MESETSETTLRPNIRIEIKNNLSVSMDKEDNSEEEGEIMDISGVELSDLTFKPKLITDEGMRLWRNEDAIFNSGMDKSEEKKLLERAKRFQLDPKEIKVFTEENLMELYKSLNINEENEEDIRFEAVHMLGSNDMSTEEVLKYFGKYGPLGIEWISDDCCNIVWSDKISAARALFFLSNPIRENCSSNEGNSILLRNKHREIELEDDSVEKMIDKSDINIPVPPGYWRAAQILNNFQYVLLRFAFRSDKKAYKAERFSEYYKKQDHGIKGLISASRKMHAKGIFSRNQEMIVEEDSDKNPWGRLAENWYEDVKYAEPEYKSSVLSKPEISSSTSALQHRLGFKRAHKSEEPSEKEKPEKKTKVPRMRMYADEEEEKIKRKLKLKLLAATSEVKLENDAGDLRNSLRLDRSTKSAFNNVTDLGVKLKNRKLKQLFHIQEQQNKRIPLQVDAYDNIRIRVEDRDDNVRSRTHSKPLYMDKVESKKTNTKRYTHEPRHDRSRHRKTSPESDYEDYSEHKTNSKVTVVIKKQKKPAVASTVWAPMHSDREKQKKLPLTATKKDSSTSSSSSTTSESSSSSSDSDSDSKKLKNVSRPGFKNNFKSRLQINPSELKSPLRIEINNDHFNN